MSQYVNENCPVCGGYVVLTTNGTKICEKCHCVLPGSNWAYSSTTTSTEKYCDLCHTKMVQHGNYYECPTCHYGYINYIGDPPKDIGEIYIKSDGVGTAWGRFDPDLIPHTLQIDTELIRLRHKEMELEFELEPDKLANIDTIILNGYKYIKEK